MVYRSKTTTMAITPEMRNEAGAVRRAGNDGRGKRGAEPGVFSDKRKSEMVETLKKGDGLHNAHKRTETLLRYSQAL